MERLSDIKFSNNSVKVAENTDGSIKAKMRRNRKKGNSYKNICIKSVENTLSSCELNSTYVFAV